MVDRRLFRPALCTFSSPPPSRARRNDVRDAADCDAIDQFRQDLHEEALATGQPTAEAEEPRGESEEGEDADAPVAPAVQQVCPATFGNSDIYGWSGAPPAP